MYARLKMPYALRGFQGIPYVLTNMETGSYDFLTRKGFQALELCDGNVDLDMVFLDKDQKEYLKDAIEQQAVEIAKTPMQIEDIQRYRKAENKYIHSIHWSVTGRCNLKCRHCYMSAPDYKYRDMNLEQCFEMIEQFQKANVSMISITGGEPFIRKDIFQILDKIYEKGMGISQIYTNGLLINENILRWFEERGKNPEFVLSFDCVGCHDWMRGIDGVESPTVEVIRLLKSHGFRVMIETALCARNIPHLLETYKLLKQCQIDYWKTSLVFEAGNWTKQNESSVAEEELYESYLDLIELYCQDGAPFAIQLDGFFSCPAGHVEKYDFPYENRCDEESCKKMGSCMTCRVHPYLLPDGTLLPCPSMTDSEIESDMPNLNEISIGEIYSDKDNPFFSLSNIKIADVLAANEECQKCEYRYVCGGGCRAMGLFAGGGILGYSPVLCLFFKKNYREKIKQKIEKFL